MVADDSHDVALFHLENPMSESRGQTCLAMAERYGRIWPIFVFKY